ncbi:MAG TPA: phosphatase PAP2 family protein [Steroidobacteraceae bacterium]|nr:phosphatase PAP2 family protein [Steroidobacteraceae bacterium]
MATPRLFFTSLDVSAPVPYPKLLIWFSLLLAVCGCRDAAAQVAPDDNEAQQSTRPHVVSELKRFVTAPARWDAWDWTYFAGSVAAVGLAHHFDTRVRNHFVAGSSTALSTKNQHDLQDAVPTALALGGTWVYANMLDDVSGRRETWTMVEAAVLSSAQTYALKYVAGRERPDETDNPNRWRKSGSSFPSLHASAAFAVGTVLAESGGDRWIRRALGYGLASLTAYERLKHNAHWLSDVVAGAALGVGSARFAMGRPNGEDAAVSFGIAPVEGGAILSCRVNLK